MPLVGITPTPAPLVFTKGGKTQTLKWKDDVVAWTKHVAPSASLDDSELVFVGYGVVAPEFDWDDYKGVDVKGKTLVMLVNDPPVPDPANPIELDPKTFGGKAMTYYGRWTYKYEIGAQKGAAGVLIIHETGPAGYGFNVVQGKTGEQFDLVTPDKNMGRAAIEGWITLDSGEGAAEDRRGRTSTTLKKQAATRDFKPVPLGVTASMTIANKLRTINSRNVIAQARRRRSEAQGRVRRLHRALGSLRQERRRHLPRRRRRCARVRGADRDGASVHQAAVAAAAIDSVSRGDRRRAGAAGIGVLLGDADLSAGQDCWPTSTWTAGTCTAGPRT